MRESATVSSVERLGDLLKPYQHTIERSLRQQLVHFGPQNRLKEACEYALLGAGKRFRPALVLMVGEGLGYASDVVLAALAIEYFHTASLIADDLPCMDDEIERRQRPALHRAYDEAVALLASYALISAGYEALARNARQIASSSLPFANEAATRSLIAVEEVSCCTGIIGATGGQFLDLYPPNLSDATLREVLYKKTVTLFEISFITGWLYGGGDPAKLPLVKKVSNHFGMAFQIADDFGDYKEDCEKGRTINSAAIWGIEQARDIFIQEMEGFSSGLKELSLETHTLLGIKEYLSAMGHLAADAAHT